MEIEVKDKEKRVNIWLTRAESQDQALLDSLKPLYKEYKAKKYLVAVFHSGNGNMIDPGSSALQQNTDPGVGNGEGEAGR